MVSDGMSKLMHNMSNPTLPWVCKGNRPKFKKKDPSYNYEQSAGKQGLHDICHGLQDPNSKRQKVAIELLHQ